MLKAAKEEKKDLLLYLLNTAKEQKKTILLCLIKTAKEEKNALLLYVQKTAKEEKKTILLYLLCILDPVDLFNKSVPNIIICTSKRELVLKLLKNRMEEKIKDNLPILYNKKIIF